MRARRLEMPWGRLKIWEAGEGPTTVLAVHGLGGSGRYWDGLAEALGDGFRVVAPDLGGFGGSSKQRDPADRAFHLATLDRVAESLAEPAVVIGHSLGGVLGMLWAARRPDAIAGLVMAASPFPSPRADWDPARWRGARGLGPRALVAAARAAWPVLSVPVQVLGPYPRAVVRDYGRQSIRSRVWTLWSLWGDPGLVPETAAAATTLVASDARVLLAYAEDDRSVGPDNGERWTALIPHAERLEVPTGGHQFLLRDRFVSVAPWIRGLPVGGHG